MPEIARSYYSRAWRKEIALRDHMLIVNNWKFPIPVMLLLKASPWMSYKLLDSNDQLESQHNRTPSASMPSGISANVSSIFGFHYWIINSGATDHMAGSHTLFLYLIPHARVRIKLGCTWIIRISMREGSTPFSLYMSLYLCCMF